MDSRLERLQQKIRPEIKNFPPYEPEPAGPRIRMDANESPFDVPTELKLKISQGFLQQAWNRYPDPQMGDVKLKLATREQVSPDQILVGNGSDEIIRDILLAYGGSNSRTVFPTPTFSMYRLLTLATAGIPVGVRLRPDWSLDLPAFLREAKAKSTRVIFLARPNNPTGNAFAREAIQAILQSTDCLVVVDEAYGLFLGESLRTWIADFPHLAILHSFSKSMSLAGLRLGYLVARPEVITTLNRIRLPYNVDTLAQSAASQVIDYWEHWQTQAQQVVKERQKLATALAQLPDLQVFPSEANFLLVRIPQAERLYQTLASQDIAVRNFLNVAGLADCLRITIGKPEENELCYRAFQAILAQRV